MPVIATVEELSRCAAVHYANEKLQTETLIEIPGLVDLALNICRWDEQRGLHLGERQSFEGALAQAKTAAPIVEWAISERARKAGSALKKDPLNRLIDEIVAKCPGISDAELFTKLEAEKGHGVIVDIADGEILFNNNGRLKAAPISGLRSRISRARQKFKRSRAR